MPDAQAIVNSYVARKNERSPWFNRALRTLSMIDGDVRLPLPEVDKEEEPAVVNLADQTVEQYGMRISSVLPSVRYPNKKFGNQAAEKRAQLMRDVNLGWWEQNNIKVRLRQMARWLVAYGSAPIVVGPGKEGIPSYEERNPLGSFPSPTSSAADITPDDCIFAIMRPLWWVMQNFPEKVAAVTQGKGIGGNSGFKPNDLVDVLEYWDADEHVLVAIAKRMPGQAWPPETANIGVELTRAANLAGICPVVVPGRLSAGRQKGMVENLFGKFMKMAKLDALEYIALKEQVFADEWIVSAPGERARIVTEADGKQGIRGVIQGGQIIRVGTDPTLLAANNIVDRLERNSRVDAGAPSQFGGENPTNVRTGKASLATVEATVDFPIQEHQELIALALQEANRRAVKTAKAYSGDTPRSFYVSWKGVQEEVNYTPNKDFYTDQSFVTYALPGLDAAQYPVAIGQRLAMRTISRKTAMEMDPMVEDPEAEADMAVVEAIDDAILGFVQARVQMPPEQGGIDLGQLIAITKSVRENRRDLPGALEAAERAAQERNAAQAAAVPGSPESQPGIGAGAGVVNEEVTGPLDEVALAMRSLRSGSAPV